MRPGEKEIKVKIKRRTERGKKKHGRTIEHQEGGAGKPKIGRSLG